MEKIIARGAEAELIRKDGELLKHRVKKGYRIPALDLQIRKLRTRREANVIDSARRAGISVPRILKVDETEGTISMEFIEGERVKEFLERASAGERKEVCEKIGAQLARLHLAGIAHGDMTTSNMILRDGQLYFIDFGLSKKTRSIEDFAIDIHLFERALTSAHYKMAKECYDQAIAAYRKAKPDAAPVLERVKVVEKRGRYTKKE